MQALTFFFAFVAVLALIGVAAWLVRRFAGNRLGANTNRGRMPRLAVIDAAAVDGRRRLVLVRRDNIEHLLMIGGPTDIVVEPNIVRAMPARDQMSPRAAVAGAEPPPRIAPLPDAGNWSRWRWRRAPTSSIMPSRKCPSRRRGRPGLLLPTKCAARRRRRRSARSERSDPLAGFTPEPLGGRPEPRPELRSEPMPSRVTSRNEPMMPRPPRPSEAPKPPPVRAPNARRRAAAAAASPPPSPRRHCRPRTKISPRWRSGWRRRLRRPAGEPANPVGAPPVAPEPPPAAARPAASHRWRRRWPPLRRRAALRIWKTRWHHCWAVQRPLREIGDSPA